VLSTIVVLMIIVHRIA